MRPILIFLALYVGTAVASQDDFHYWSKISYEKSLPNSLATINIDLKILDDGGKESVEFEKIEISGIKMEVPEHVLGAYPIVMPASLWLSTSHLEEDSTVSNTIITLYFDYQSDSCKHKGAISFLDFEYVSHTVSTAQECS